MKRMLVAGFLLLLLSGAHALTFDPRYVNGVSAHENLRTAKQATIVRVESKRPYRNAQGGIETEYSLRAERSILGEPIHSITRFGGELDGERQSIMGLPELEIGKLYLILFTSWGHFDPISGQTYMSVEVDDDALGRTSIEEILDARHRHQRTQVPTWPAMFDARQRGPLYAWAAYRTGPLALQGSPEYAAVLQTSLSGAPNYWTPFLTPGANPLLQIVTLPDDQPIAHRNGRNEYWGVRTRAEIQHYFGFNATGVCGIVFRSNNDVDMVIVEGCKTANVINHELGHFLSLDHPFDWVNMNVPSLMDYSCASRVAAADIRTLKHWYPEYVHDHPDLLAHDYYFSDGPSNYAACSAIFTEVNQSVVGTSVTVDNPTSQNTNLLGLEAILLPLERRGENPTASDRYLSHGVGAELIPAPYGKRLLPVDPTLPGWSSKFMQHRDFEFGDSQHRMFGCFGVGVYPVRSGASQPNAAGLDDIVVMKSLNIPANIHRSPFAWTPPSEWTPLPFKVGAYSLHHQQINAPAGRCGAELAAALTVAVDAGDMIQVDYCGAFADTSHYPTSYPGVVISDGNPFHPNHASPNVRQLARFGADLSDMATCPIQQYEHYWPQWSYTSDQSRVLYLSFITNPVAGVHAPSGYRPFFNELQPGLRLLRRGTLASRARNGRVISADHQVNCAGSCVDVLPVGSTVVLTATPDADYAFHSWTGDCEGSGPVCTLQMDTAKAVAARFGRGLDVVVFGDGRVISTESPPSIDCPPRCSTSDYPFVRLEAYPSNDWVIDRWVGCPTPPGAISCSVPGSFSGTVEAHFAVRPDLRRELSLTVAGDGLVRGMPGDMTCRDQCTFTVPVGQSVQLQAIPDPDSDFQTWGGDCPQEHQLCQLTMSDDASVTALFEIVRSEIIFEHGFE